MTDRKLPIEGVYILDEWTINGQTFQPPAVEGTRMTFIQTPDNISVLQALPWEGMREFTVKQHGNSVQLQFGDKAALAFDPDGLKYSEAGKVLRVRHRAKSE